MNSVVLHKILLIWIFVNAVLIISWGQNVNPPNQSSKNKNYTINWISQYPKIKKEKDSENKKNKFSDIILGVDKREKKSSNNWFTNLLFGAKSSGLIKPMSVLAISPDTFWVADQGHGSILKVFKQVGEITQFKNKNIENIPSIVGSCFMPNNKIIFTDSRLNKIFWFSKGNRELHIFNNSVLLEQPTGVAYSSVNKEVWVVETKAHRISILDENGKLIKQFGSRGIAPGQFNFPTYIWIDKLGMVYVVDAMNFRIQIFDRTGTFVSTFGEIGDASGYFTRPKGIATDSYGHIYVADAMFHVVQVFDRSGNLLYVFGSQGQEKEQFWMPTGIYIDEENYIYIADSYNSRVQVFKLTFED